jgi:hypothetical protein
MLHALRLAAESADQDSKEHNILVEVVMKHVHASAVKMGATRVAGAGREAQTPRLVGACEMHARVFFWGALRCLASIESPTQKKKRRDSDGLDYY